MQRSRRGEQPRTVIGTIGEDERHVGHVATSPRYACASSLDAAIDDVVVTAVAGVELVGEQRTRRRVAIDGDDPWTLRSVPVRACIASDPSQASRTGNENIIPLWLCSAMWQCAIHSPGS